MGEFSAGYSYHLFIFSWYYYRTRMYRRKCVILKLCGERVTDVSLLVSAPHRVWSTIIWSQAISGLLGSGD